MSKFEVTYCSQCGGEFGPGDHGYSHCKDHSPTRVTDLEAGLREAIAALEGVEKDTNYEFDSCVTPEEKCLIPRLRALL